MKKELKLNLKDIEDKVEISDGYHTFDELYEHRHTLFIALCKQVYESTGMENTGKYTVWRSRLHSNYSRYSGMFILGIGITKGQQITYHLPNEKWDECFFALTLNHAPKYDKHTPEDVLERIKLL